MDTCIEVTAREAAELLRGWDRILIICHKKPDGDTLGSGFALLYSLLSMGKTARVECSDGFPKRYGFLYKDYDTERQAAFEPEHVVAVDVADTQLFGEATAVYADRVDLCVDHHPSNTRYARRLFLDPRAAGTVECIYDIIAELGAPLDLRTATCLYTGLTTDTGCFRYSNVTPRTHYLAAKMIEAGVDHFPIDKLMFETKTKARLDLERRVLETLCYAFDGRMAMVLMSTEALEATGVPGEDTDGIASIPRQIEGVEVGATFKQEGPTTYRISLRTNEFINASRVCGQLGGGGHARAAGCTLEGTLEQAREQLCAALAPEFEEAAQRRRGTGG